MWHAKALRYLDNRFGEETVRDWAARLAFADTADPHSMRVGFDHAVHYLLFIHRDGDRTAAEQWEASGWGGLDNDERVMMQYRRHTLPTIVEIQEVLNDHAMRCSDVLNPERGAFVAFDRGAARMALPYTRLLVGLTHYPHFSRFVGGGVEVTHQVFETFLDELHERAASKGDSAVVKRWLAEHFRDGHRLLNDISEDHREQMFRSLDVHHCRAHYRLKAARSDVRDAVVRKPDFLLNPDPGAPDDLPPAEHFVWLRRGETAGYKHPPKTRMVMDANYGGIPTLGNLWLADEELIVETFSRSKFDFAKKMATQFFGALLEFDHETVKNMAEAIGRKQRREEKTRRREFQDAQDIPAVPAASGVPPEVERKVMSDWFLRHYTKFLDDPVPALSNHTPREAANDPVLRPRLVDLMKQHIQGVASMNRGKGQQLSLDWLLQELDLHELLPHGG